MRRVGFFFLFCHLSQKKNTVSLKVCLLGRYGLYVESIFSHCLAVLSVFLALVVTYEACCRARPCLQSKIILSLPGSKAVLCAWFISSRSYYPFQDYSRNIMSLNFQYLFSHLSTKVKYGHNATPLQDVSLDFSHKPCIEIHLAKKH